jgi:hypothetical protein
LAVVESQDDSPRPLVRLEHQGNTPVGNG